MNSEEKFSPFLVLIIDKNKEQQERAPLQITSLFQLLVGGFSSLNRKVEVSTENSVRNGNSISHDLLFVVSTRFRQQTEHLIVDEFDY